MRPILVQGEEISRAFHESFNWDLTKTWALLTTFRIVLIRYLPWKIDIEDFHLKDLNLELKRDNIGPYDVIQFKDGEDILYDLAVLRNRRKKAESFIHAVSENIRRQGTYDTANQEYLKTYNTTSNGIRPKKPLDPKAVEWCKRKLDTLLHIGAITKEEYEDERKNNPECK